MSVESDPIVGTTIGSYVVHRRLGEGGMGAVYELLHPGIQKRLAMKLLHAEYAAKPEIVQRFFDEARAVNLIGHPNIVDITDFATLPDGRSYIIMEFLEGESLAEHIRRTGPMPAARVREILLPICAALEAAHGAGIVHRDLKPENIHLVPPPHHVKVLDFGIAKLSSHGAPGASTRSGVVMGTPSYMSPEQAMGRTREIDHRTDIYAVGIITYELLTGHVPFRADSFGDLMLKHLHEAPPGVAGLRPDLPPGWAQLVTIALAKVREERFQSMREFAEAVEAAAAGRPVARMPSGGRPTVTEGPGASRTVPLRAQPVPPSPASAPGGGFRADMSTLSNAASQSSASHGPAAGRLPRWVVAAGLVAALGAAGAVAALVATRGGEPATAAASETPARDAAVALAAAPPDAAATAPPDARATATLVVHAEPRGARLYVDGEHRGQGSATVTVPVGAEVEVRAEMAGCQPATEPVVMTGEGAEVQLKLRRSPRRTAEPRVKQPATSPRTKPEPSKTEPRRVPLRDSDWVVE
jgi:eukaryotic-like serine/threonine-protein kinase